MPHTTDTPPALPSLPFGQRAQRARERAGKTRTVIADRVGQSTEWVKAIETGRIGMPRLPKLLRLAHALGVEDITELIGDERIAAATYTKAEHTALPVVRQALTRYQLRPADREPEPAAVLAARVRHGWKLWHADGDHRTAIVALLPKLLDDTQHSSRALDGPDRRRAQVALAEAYHLAQLFLSFQPAPDLVFLTGDRAMAAAQDADSPRAIAAAARDMKHVHRDAGE